MNEVTATQKREKKALAEAQENAEERDKLEDKFIGENHNARNVLTAFSSHLL